MRIAVRCKRDMQGFNDGERRIVRCRRRRWEVPLSHEGFLLVPLIHLFLPLHNHLKKGVHMCVCAHHKRTISSSQSSKGLNRKYGIRSIAISIDLDGTCRVLLNTLQCSFCKLGVQSHGCLFVSRERKQMAVYVASKIIARSYKLFVRFLPCRAFLYVCKIATACADCDRKRSCHQWHIKS